MKSIEPQDQIEAMLASQMAAVRMATMTFARRLAHCETIPQQDSAERAFNKLTRTFAAQVEALKKYRTGGQQHVTVKHVTVNEGGQAIVGNVSHGGRVTEKNNVNLMNLAPRCHARSKRTGCQCRPPAVRGSVVCRMHGAGGGAPEGKRNGNYRNGGRTKRTMAALAVVQAMARICRQTIDDLPD
ncbi:hypothetical protein [Mesorhizobium sp.]|uniref:hypothetical protein n=1 Tax=Mesorhizobium sp. TaxID=1871066 RepID=UPI000FE6BF32|nr:hypothetical protein [Mesorhizobium sp.]RWP70780.1 MAG: hypothetical protein EOR09_25800 [Mesorhizobium sp.]